MLSKRIRTLLIVKIMLVISLLLVVSTAGFATEDLKNIILMIGDGNGISQITATRIALGGPDAVLNVDTMPYTGLVKTHSASNITTDSAASGTALATGMRTNNSRLGTLSDGTRLKSLSLIARDAGMGTGVVTTDNLVGATPAAFMVQVAARSFAGDIAEQVLASSLDVFLGGGLDDFGAHPFTRAPRPNSLISQAIDKGYTFVSNQTDMAEVAPGEKLLGLFAPKAMSLDKERLPMEPSLAEMTAKAIELLEDKPSGFFLMVEAARIDYAGHNNLTEEMLGEGLAFDEAIGVALEFARGREDTLVIVTADHETGGFSIVSGSPDGASVTYDWHLDDHTGQMVPLYAFGPGSERFTGTHHHEDVSKIMADLLGFTPYPQFLED